MHVGQAVASPGMSGLFKSYDILTRSLRSLSVWTSPWAEKRLLQG